MDVAAIRVMVVDDSVVVRKIVADVIDAEADIDVVGTAIHGRAALDKLDALCPDVITMDIEMPEMDGIEAVRRIRATGSRVPIIMFSTLTERAAKATFDALGAGANDYVTKPANVGSITASMESVRVQLIPRLRALTGRAAPSAPAPPVAGDVPAPAAGARTSAPAAPVRPVSAPATRKDARVLVIGASTGGPEALTQVIPRLPADLGVPVLVVQHMPPLFTTQFAARLDRLSPLRVVEATSGAPLAPGTVHVAPGGQHLHVAAGPAPSTRLSAEAPENFCRPAVDVLFRSAVAAYGGAVMAVVLTGMGADGRAGAGLVRAGGGWVIAQDQATSVVWGMPGAVVQAGYADETPPLGQVVTSVLRRLPRTRPDAPGAPRPSVTAGTTGTGSSPWAAPHRPTTGAR